jgi:hypothetical protein
LARLLDRLRSYGFVSIRRDPAADALLIEAERFRARVEMPPGVTVVGALERITPVARDADLSLRFHLAAVDMRSVAAVCRQMPALGLATPENAPGLWLVLQAGIVVVYARSFDGNAALGGRWRPEGEEERVLHQALLDGRSAIFAHADHTPHRAGLYMDGEMSINEVGIHPEELPNVAAMCEAQAARFQAEADRLLASIQDVLVPSGSQSEIFGTLPPSPAADDE